MQLSKSYIKAFLAFLLILNCFALYGNVGVFNGYGQSIALSGTESVQMTEEDILIIPGRGNFLFDGTIPGMDWVSYNCRFKLKNLEDRQVKIPVGFPLTSELFEQPGSSKLTTTDLVRFYSFIAQEEGHQYTVSHFSEDKDGKLKNIFQWEMAFKQNEEKILYVSYRMPISMSLGSTAVDWKKSDYNRAWLRRLEDCVIEWFGYVTETGKTWHSQIGKADFKVYTKGFEKYLKQRPLFEGYNGENRPHMQKKFPVFNRPTIFTIIGPEGWKENKRGILELSYSNYVPTENIVFRYFMLPFPQTAEDTELLVKALLRKGFTDDDYQDLIDIFREFNGINTNNEHIQDFLKNQIWYKKDPYEKIPDIVFDTIEKIRNKK